PDLAQLKTVRQFRNHANIRSAPPFAVGHHVHPRLLLDRDDVAHSRVQAPLILLRRNILVAGDEVPHKLRARHGSNDGGGEKGGDAHGRAFQCVWASSKSCCVSISMYSPGVSAWAIFTPA